MGFSGSGPPFAGAGPHRYADGRRGRLSPPPPPVSQALMYAGNYAARLLRSRSFRSVTVPDPLDSYESEELAAAAALWRPA